MPIRRTIKNVVKNYSDSQIKVREATSNDPWGPSTTLMAEISDLTYNVVAFTEIMRMVWKRLNDHGKNWRHVYKSLMLLDYLIKNGSEKVAQQCKENIYAIQTLCDFQYVEDNKDNGLNVREKAKQLVSLLKDEERLKNTRVKAHKARERLAQNSLGHPPPSMASSTDRYDYAERSVDVPRSQLDEARPADPGEEEIQLQLALAISKEEHDEEVKRNEGDDMRLRIAIEQSKQDRPAAPTAGAAAPPSTELLDLATPPPAASAGADPWGASAAPPPYPTDPWGAEASPPYPPAQPSAAAAPQPVSQPDPWSSVSPAAAPSADPWGSNTTSPAEVSTDPWSSPITDEQAASTLDWLGDDPTPSNGVSKPTSDPWSQQTTTTLPPTQPQLTEPKNDVFDLSSLDPVASMNQQRTNSGSKTPESFLGDHSRLVNLDQLVAPPAPSGTAANTGLAFAPLPQNPGLNPFMSSSTQPNPFAQTTAKPTLNQMQTQNTGFSSVGAGGLLPAPLQPSGQPVASNNSNPFL